MPFIPVFRRVPKKSCSTCRALKAGLPGIRGVPSFSTTFTPCPAKFYPSSQLLLQQVPTGKASSQSPSRGLPKVENQTNCVPVIQRTHNLELSENDTDTDSGYGGEGEKLESKSEGQNNVGAKGQGANGVTVKQEPLDEPAPKRFKPDCSGPGSTAVETEPAVRPDANLLNSLMGFGSSPFSQQAPFCLPFYFISPSAAAAAAAYMPFLDKGNLEKYLYPAAAAAAAPIPFIYPGLPAQRLVLSHVCPPSCPLKS
ncbi:unnamed protein product [Staurois parvus]|uniref:Uncharacterized protein n=1 Tax=Staurois parvus TaxID=386267 RepID=A0ABN9EEJ2_9NEOB|nr:unnamed protein product [Staurois parvus]